MTDRPKYIFNLFTLFALVLSLFGSAVDFTPVYAGTFNASNPTELIAAINTANSNSADDVIYLTADILLTAVDNSSISNGENGLPVILGDGGSTLTIEGAGFTIEGAGGAPQFRLFEVASGANLTLNNIIIRNGNTTYGGGGVFNLGTLAVTNSTFENNVSSGGGAISNGGPSLTVTSTTFSYNEGQGVGGAIDVYAGSIQITNSSFLNNTASSSPGYAGAIYIQGTTSVTIDKSTFVENDANAGGAIYNLTNSKITDSSFDGNISHGNGGGIYNQGGNLELTDSVLVNNEAESDNGGGGIYVNGGTLTVKSSTFITNIANEDGGGVMNLTTTTITNSTFFGNIAGTAGGGVSNGGTLTVENSTFSENDAPAVGSGIYNGTGHTLNLTNTIIANPVGAGGACFNDGTIGTDSNNLIEDDTYACSLTNGINGDIIGNVGVDPALGPLQDNGGLTPTMAITTTSTAYNVGSNTYCPSTDQRGVARPQNTTCDIGAYEVDTTYPTVIATSLVPTYTTGPSSFTVTFSENVSNLFGGSDPNDAENPDNYILIEVGATSGFQTTACNNTDFVQDTQILVNSVSYSPNTSTVNLSITPPVGTYRLFVCGTTSIMDPGGLELNNGASDYTFDFVVGPVSSAPSSLPDTGFAPNRITPLSTQSTSYTNLGSIWLEIPKLGVKSEIVGVPQSSDGWNVDWLGNSIGWLNGTAFPSWEGNSVITGHVYDANGLPGPFQKVKNLKSGDQVIVHMFGEKYIFEVRESEMVFPSKTSYALQHLEGYSYLTLITCQWYNPITDSYAFRRVVRAVLVDVQGE